MSTELQFDLDPSIKREFGTLAGDARVARTAAALGANGIRAIRAPDAAEAKRIVLHLIGWIAGSLRRVAVARGIRHHR